MEIQNGLGLKMKQGSGGFRRTINIPCTENDILHLETICMVPGIHTIKVPSFTSGRELIKKILKALSWHQNIASLSLQDHSEYIGQDITNTFQAYDNEEQKETFFVQSFNYDCLFIEKTVGLSNKKWFKEFESYLLGYKFDLHIPIIIIEE